MVPGLDTCRYARCDRMTCSPLPQICHSIFSSHYTLASPVRHVLLSRGLPLHFFSLISGGAPVSGWRGRGSRWRQTVAGQRRGTGRRPALSSRTAPLAGRPRCRRRSRQGGSRRTGSLSHTRGALCTAVCVITYRTVPARLPGYPPPPLLAVSLPSQPESVAESSSVCRFQ